MPAFQVLDDLYSFFRPSRDGVNIAEFGIECPAMPGNLDCLLKLNDGLIVQVFLLQRLAQFVVTNGKLRIQLQCFPALLLGQSNWWATESASATSALMIRERGSGLSASFSSAMASLFRPI